MTMCNMIDTSYTSSKDTTRWDFFSMAVRNGPNFVNFRKGPCLQEPRFVPLCVDAKW